MALDYPAAISYNRREQEDGDFTDEMIAYLVSHYQAATDLESDGKCGPQTQRSLNYAMGLAPVNEPVNGNWNEPGLEYPKTRGDVYEIFGDPGSGHVSRRWKAKNIVDLHGDDRLPGVPARFYVQAHRLVEPYLREALRRAQLSSDYEIERLGGFNFRHIRHDPKRPLSMHSWGIAVDINARDNFAKSFKRGSKPAPFTDLWRDIWPQGMDENFVKAFKSCGWFWGGDWQTYADPMHFEWRGLPGYP